MSWTPGMTVWPGLGSWGVSFFLKVCGALTKWPRRPLSKLQLGPFTMNQRLASNNGTGGGKSWGVRYSGGPRMLDGNLKLSLDEVVIVWGFKFWSTYVFNCIHIYIIYNIIIIYKYMYMYLHLNNSEQINQYYIDLNEYIYIYINTYIYINIHTHIYIYIHIHYLNRCM